VRAKQSGWFQPVFFNSRGDFPRLVAGVDTAHSSVVSTQTKRSLASIARPEKFRISWFNKIRG
jgi:hypothetical protein